MISRRGFIGTMAGGLLAAPLAVEAQPTGKVYRIGWLPLGFPSASSSFRDVFLLELRRLGYSERQDFVLEDRYADGKDERRPHAPHGLWSWPVSRMKRSMVS
jgi:putative ABC transport system substrate-binding protein